MDHRYVFLAHLLSGDCLTRKGIPIHHHQYIVLIPEHYDLNSLSGLCVSFKLVHL